ncbi:hypothetical protein ACHMZP_30515 [Rhodococcus baikonurensis]|uniref:hypothetical protein n=1 Tax=Rhodococcus baikonurensis TaxID=172041 RepID=UPI0037AA6DE6
MTAERRPTLSLLPRGIITGQLTFDQVAIALTGRVEYGHHHRHTRERPAAGP